MAEKKKKGYVFSVGNSGTSQRGKQSGPNKTTVEATNLPDQTGKSPKRRSIMANEQIKGNAAEFDFSEMSKVWKEAYLKGLESCLKLQEESERLVNDTIKQGFTGSQNWLTLYMNSMEMPWDQFQGQATTVPNPFLALARQSLQAFQAAAEPVVKTAAETYEKTFANYETALAGPFRKQVIEINKKVVDALVSF